MADLNLVALTGFATRDATLRQKSSGQVKAEFSFEVDRPFYRATGEPVSDLFLVDVWEDLGRWAVEHIKEGMRLVVMGTLNKESYSTRGGREHLTIVKAKFIRAVEDSLLEDKVDVEEMKRDSWNMETLLATVGVLEAALQDGSDETEDDSYGDSGEF